jgi:hypothetical protein
MASAETEAGARDADTDETTCGDEVLVGLAGGTGGVASSLFDSSPSSFSGREESFNSVDEDDDDWERGSE